MRSALIILLAAAAPAAFPAGGEAAVDRAVPEPAAYPAGSESAVNDPAPWATVNLCDTLERPNQMGIRGSMPGLARRTRMYMRFRVQYETLEGKWRMVKGDVADSGWRSVAIGRRGEHDAGWTFEFKPPATGGAHILRGVVSFQWRRLGTVVRRDRRVTEDGHPGTAGADPPEFSEATCAIA